MNASRNLFWCAALAALLLATGACGPKASPDIPAETMTDTPPPFPEREATEVTGQTPSTAADRQPAIGDMEVMEADRHARETGLIGDIYFDFDKYDLKPEARDRLSKNADFLKQNPAFLVEIQGHCDERGTNDYNIALADRRANAAREYLVTLGVGANRMKTVSYGEERPVCTESNESCWWRNRRGEFHLVDRASS